MKKTFIFIALMLFIAVSLTACILPFSPSRQSSEITEEISALTSDYPPEPEPEQKRENYAGYADYIKGDEPIIDCELYDESTMIVLFDARAEIYNIEECSLICVQELGFEHGGEITVTDDGRIIYSSVYGGYDIYPSPSETSPIASRKNLVEVPNYEEGEGDDPDYYDESEFDNDTAEDARYYFLKTGEYIEINGSDISLNDIDSGNTKVIDSERDYDYLELKQRDGRRLYLTGYRNNSSHGDAFYLDLDGETYTHIDSVLNKNCLADGDRFFEWSYGYNESILTYIFGSAVRTEIRLEGLNESLLSANGDIIYTAENEDGKITFRSYDLNGNLFYREKAEVDEENYTDAEDIAVLGGTAVYKLSRYDMELERVVNTLYIVVNSLDEELERGFSPTLYDMSEEFFEHTGFTINLGKLADRWFPDYNVEICENKSLIKSCIETIEDVLAEFPEGFFDEIFTTESENADRGIEIYLVNNIIQRDEGSISSAAAFTYSDVSTRIIVIDATIYYSDYLKNTVAHELMHCIDDYMLYHGDYFKDWFDYLPSSSVYHYSYVDRYGNDYYDAKYTIDSGRNVYFIDSYSKTFPGEDRARLFEYMFCPEMAEGNACFTYPNIASRAEYLASEIRRCFKTVSDSDTLCWESTIEQYIENEKVA